MKKIVCIVGTRPQLVKHSVLINLLKQDFLVETLNTCQHYQFELNELLQEDLFENEFFLQLDIARDLLPAARLGEMINKIANYLNKSKPDSVIVYGDTDSTLAGALAAHKSKINLIHIEAGERSGNMEMPEENNRIITDSLSDILFCSSKKALLNLNKESSSKKVIYCGDLMKDLILKKSSLATRKSLNKDYIYCTIHRNYNQNNPRKLQELLKALQLLNTTIIFPLHPATLKTIQSFCPDLEAYANIQFQSPLTYSDSICYQKFAKAIITDSGGIQKEAYWLKRPCITIRKETEWTETLKGQWNQLLYENISLLHDYLYTQPVERCYDPELYGNGNAGNIINTNLISILN